MSNEKFQLVPIQDIEKMAIAVSKSQLFGMKTPEAAMALMLIAQSEGLHPARAAMEYHIINGKPSLKADAMLSRFQMAGGKVEWHKYTDTACEATLSHPSGGSVKVEWTFKQAQDAGLTSNPTWKKFPRAMLRSRVISEGIRTVFPGVSVGMYTPEEVEEFTPQPPKDMGKVEVVKEPMPMPEPKPMPQKVKDAAKGKATVISDKDEGDLSGIGDNKPSQDKLDAVAKAFKAIGMDAEMVADKKFSDWTMEDLAGAREIYADANKRMKEATEVVKHVEGEVV